MALAPLSAVAVGVLQSTTQASQARRHKEALFRQQIDQEDAQHRRIVAQCHEQHHEHANMRRQLYNNEMFQQDMLAQKEAMRDVWQQVSEVVQSRMIVATLFLGSSLSTISDGFPQLVLNVIPLWNADSNRTAGGGSNATSSDSEVGQVSTSGSVPALLWVLSVSAALANLVLVLSVFVTLVLYRRLTTFEVDKPLKRYPFCGHTHRTVDSFVECQCRSLEKVGLLSLYVGSALALISALSLQGLKYKIVYEDLNSLEGALIVTVGIGFAVVTACIVLVRENTRMVKQKGKKTASSPRLT